MSNNLSKMSKEQLSSILDETEGQIAEIRAELERRQQAEQHEAIDALEFPVARTAIEWSQVKAFFAQVLEDLRGGSATR